jgi:signal transduction histidine kinase
MPLAFWLARRVTAPFDNFARAAEQLGRDPLASPLLVTGPREVRRAAQAFNDMQLRVRRYVEDRTGMVGAISHDLRTPLARIRFKLENEPPNKASIIADLEQMDGMIRHVLAFLREGRELRERERIDLLSLVETVVDEAVGGGAEVRLVQEDEGAVEGDVSALMRLLANLIGNAVKYGTRADVRVIRGLGELRVEIEDDGPGLSPGDREAVFRPFYRTEAARTLDVGGVGLGLALSRSIARGHGGDLTVEVRRRGLVAVLTLPTAAGA